MGLVELYRETGQQKYLDCAKPFAIRVRIPGWATGATAAVNGVASANAPVAGQYLFMKRPWQSGDVIELNLPMPVRLMQAHPKAEQLRNQVAVMRGPLLYCLESKDLPEGLDLNNVYIPDDLQLDAQAADDLPFGIVALDGQGALSRGTVVDARSLSQSRTAAYEAAANPNDPLLCVGEPRTGRHERLAAGRLEQMMISDVKGDVAFEQIAIDAGAEFEPDTPFRPAWWRHGAENNSQGHGETPKYNHRPIRRHHGAGFDAGEVELIPYYAWNNREEPKMSVWLPLIR